MENNVQKNCPRMLYPRITQMMEWKRAPGNLIEWGADFDQELTMNGNSAFLLELVPERGCRIRSLKVMELNGIEWNELS